MLLPRLILLLLPGVLPALRRSFTVTKSFVLVLSIRGDIVGTAPISPARSVCMMTRGFGGEILILLAPTMAFMMGGRLRLELIVPVLLRRATVVSALLFTPLVLLLLPALTTLLMIRRLLLRPLGLLGWDRPLVEVVALFLPLLTSGGEAFTVISHPLLWLCLRLIGEIGSAGTIKRPIKLAAHSSILTVLAAAVAVLLLPLRLPMLPLERRPRVLLLLLLLTIVVLLALIVWTRRWRRRRRRRHLPPTFTCAAKLASATATATSSVAFIILAHVLPAAVGFSAAIPGLLMVLIRVRVLIPIPSIQTIIPVMGRRADTAMVPTVRIPI